MIVRASVLLLACPALCLSLNVNILGPQSVNLWRLQASTGAKSGLLVQDSSLLTPEDSKKSSFAPQWFTQPLDHFSNSSDTFAQRFWVNTRHYRPQAGRPVFVLDGGETNGEDRLPFLDTGIMEILARATGGLSVVLEHRYYGMCIVQPFLNGN